MRRSLLSAALLFVLLTVPASAQLFPGHPVSAERVILDIVLVAELPSEQDGLCTIIEPGTLTVRSRLLLSDPPTGAQFALGDRDGPDGSLAILMPLDSREQTMTAVLTKPGAVYCWGVDVFVPGVVGNRPRQVTHAAIRMTLVPN